MMPDSQWNLADVWELVAELMPEKSRARLTCVCKVGREVVLDGEALVKVPSAKAGKGKRPVLRL